jgi:hypothetical protein
MPRTPVRKLPESLLTSLYGSTLFYPCAGHDVFLPLELFAPFVTEFWFVDRGYFIPGHQDTRSYCFDLAADQIAPLLKDDARYELVETTIEGPASSREKREIEPCILSEVYRHLASGRFITVRRRRGYGFSAFRKEIRSLGVFFYRGDSEGEGGSGNLWLAADHVREVCEKLIDGGLIVTDGSQGGWMKRRTPYQKLSELAWKRVSGTADEKVRKAGSFSAEGRTFSCVAYVGQRYGPTLVWQVTSSGSQTNLEPSGDPGQLSLWTTIAEGCDGAPARAGGSMRSGARGDSRGCDESESGG